MSLYIRCFLLMMLTVPLTACEPQDTLTWRYQDYMERVANVLDRSVETEKQLAAIRYPEKRERLQTIDSFAQGVVEVWDFKRCQLMELINKRNSNLGKVMPPSQRYIYENLFWQKLKPCYEKREQWRLEDEDFVQRLEETYEHKKAIQSVVIHQLFFAGDELASQFSQTQQPFSPEQRPEYQSIEDALNFLAQLQQQAFAETVNTQQVEQHLQSLYHQPVMHALLKSLQTSTFYLNQTADLIEKRLSRRPLCLNNRSTPKADILFNVLQKFYLQNIQPVIAHHSRMANRLLPPLNRIFLSAEPGTPLADYQQRWLSQTEQKALWQRFLTANQRHTQVWNRLLRQCNLFPKGFD